MTNEEKLRFIQFNYVNARASELMPADKKEIFFKTVGRRSSNDCPEASL